MNIPLVPKWTVDLVPVYVAGGKDISIGSQEMGVGQYAHLTYIAQVTGEAICLMVLSKSA
jgi:hypothetical protein